MTDVSNPLISYFSVSRLSATCINITVQAHLQHYVEPSAANAPVDNISTVTSSINSTLLPLGSGTFTNNAAGVPIVIACTKADLIDEEEDVALGTMKGKGGEWEERTDGIMQVLRTICLRCTSVTFVTPSIYSYRLCRRRVSLLHNTTACYIASAAPVRVTHAVYTTSTFTWLRARRTASQPLPIHS